MPRSPRILTVLVGTLPIEDGQTPPPVVGEVGRYWLLFVEATRDVPDATVVTVRARAEPLGDGSPQRGGLMWDGTVRDEPPHWPTMLHGNGWSASWSAPRPVVGEVAVRGTVVADLGFGAHGSVRGRVTRARTVTETFDTTDPDQPRVPALQRLHEVDTGPRWFDHGRAPGPGGHGTVPRIPYEVEVGVLVDLDLDDVPPLPLRPSIVPGALSVSGSDVWVADARLPCVVGLRDGRVVTRFDWPGRILSADESRGRGVHADGDGAWITGPDGVHRCDGDGVRAVLAEDAWVAAASDDGLLAVQLNREPCSPTLRLVRPSGEVIDVVIPDRVAGSIAADGDGFLLLVTTPRQDAGPRVARLSRTGEYREGLPLPGRAHDYGEVLGGGLTGGGEGLYRVRPDLGLDDGPSMPRRVLRVWSGGGRIRVLTHVHDDGGWPLTGAAGPRPGGRCWLLADLDAADLSPIRSTFVPAVPTSLSADGEWLLAAGVRRWDQAGSGRTEPVDIAALLDRSG